MNKKSELSLEEYLRDPDEWAESMAERKAFVDDLQKLSDEHGVYIMTFRSGDDIDFGAGFPILTHEEFEYQMEPERWSPFLSYLCFEKK